MPPLPPLTSLAAEVLQRLVHLEQDHEELAVEARGNRAADEHPQPRKKRLEHYPEAADDDTEQGEPIDEGDDLRHDHLVEKQQILDLHSFTPLFLFVAVPAAGARPAHGNWTTSR